ncbi:hypothetical protein AOQ84DRAFT_176515 [Glonium stellatum]|uniref:Uncharacterized protein n=1 Tax=Glonium stellatum TaxID=574774 RepID=A0A8E2F777_9PEZI|nr:hypothetical protein AOQ84DRAFT_176515 [Glonium stellatum]
MVAWQHGDFAPIHEKEKVHLLPHLHLHVYSLYFYSTRLSQGKGPFYPLVAEKLVVPCSPSQPPPFFFYLLFFFTQPAKLARAAAAAAFGTHAAISLLAVAFSAARLSHVTWRLPVHTHADRVHAKGAGLAFLSYQATLNITSNRYTKPLCIKVQAVAAPTSLARPRCRSNSFTLHRPPGNPPFEANLPSSLSPTPRIRLTASSIPDGLPHFATGYFRPGEISTLHTAVPPIWLRSAH